MNRQKLEQLAQLVASKLPNLPSELLEDALILRVTPENLIETMTLLRDDADLNFKQMIDLCGVHYPTRDKPLEVVYQLLSVHKNHRIRLKLALDENTPAPTVTEIWSCADWYERETYEMFGILFAGHPDLRRLLTDYDFDGYPLRKDFPLNGLTDVYYDEKTSRVVTRPMVMERPDREPYPAKT